MPFLSTFTPWVASLVATVVTIAVAYAAGHLFNGIVMRRLARTAARTREEWDDIVVVELRRRIPFWSLLIGAQLSLPYWNISHPLAARVLPALGVASVTLATAAVVSRLVVIYGPRASPGLPVAGITHRLVRIVITTLGVLVIIRSFGDDITPMLTALGVGGLAVALALLPSADMGISVDFTLDAAGDLALVERVILEVASEVQRTVGGAVTNAEPSLRYQGFTDTGVRCSVGLRVRDFVDQFVVRHELVKRLQARFAREGIALAIPSMRVAAALRPPAGAPAE